MSSGRDFLFGKKTQRLAHLSTLAILLVASNTEPVVALPLTAFRHQWQAEKHCPSDRVVWLDFAKGIYYVQGQRHFAKGHSGSFVCMIEAQRSGYRRSVFGIR
ncbi:exported hypothetical protein [Bradyrhizobium sp. STM 3843]|uniref:hypothetical protein n=1 Tax=Bradyrhizobium sp. STM 3843 TaxID=551947 RepID=UPI0002404060|nr:hypothetical protein [Bradyrhizobium sp. STM 3843]CCE10367.1 exported hypothetical protein [Bradyrhizobium sp. STM 3843]